MGLQIQKSVPPKTFHHCGMNLDCTLSREDWLVHNKQSNHHTKTNNLEKSQEKIKKKIS